MNGDRISEISRFCVNRNSTVRDALTVINGGNYHIALVIDEAGKLIGTVTDGDVRRGLLRGLDLESNICAFMQKEFVKGDEGESELSLLQRMEERQILQIPILDKQGKPLGLVNGKERCGESRPNLVLIMAGGEGKRLRPLTKTCPKPMLKIGGKPILERLINQLRQQGFKRFCVSVKYLKEQIVEYFGDGSDFGVSVEYVTEDQSLGTAGALKLIQGKEVHPIVVTNGDVITPFSRPEMIRYFMLSKANATVASVLHVSQVPYGIIETREDELIDFKEKPVITHLANAGIYVIRPETIRLIERDERIDMPDLLLRIREHMGKVTVFPIHEHWIDVGIPENLKLAEDRGF